MTFYDELGEHYDEVVGTAGRVGPARRFVEWLTARGVIGLAADVACGTGLYAAELLRAGVNVVASDVSPSLLEQARANLAKLQRGQGPISASPRLACVLGPMQEVDRQLADANLAGRKQGDAILCMGNSIPHLLGDEDLQQAVAAFAAGLVDGGVAAVQLLNYSRVLKDRQRIVGITRCGDREYIRFYDFPDGPGLLRFNILEVLWQGNQAGSVLRETVLRPYRPGELRDAFLAGGFKRVDFFGGLDGRPFDEGSSDTVLCLCVR